MWKDELRTILNSNFSELKLRNHRYSLRAYARKLKISHSTLSQILNQQSKRQWFMTAERACEILDVIEVPNHKKNALRIQLGQDPKLQKKEFAHLGFDTLADWIWHAVLMCFDLPEIHHTIPSISERFGRPESEIQFYIDALLEKGALIRDPQGRIRRFPDFIETHSSIELRTPIRDFHKSSLKLAERGLQAPVPERDYSVVTFATSKDKMDMIRKETARYLERIVSLAEPGECDEVYRVSVQIFPLRQYEENEL
jgi:transcriptional regulator with XRE-family HTH domain